MQFGENLFETAVKSKRVHHYTNLLPNSVLNQIYKFTLKHNKTTQIDEVQIYATICVIEGENFLVYLNLHKLLAVDLRCACNATRERNELINNVRRKNKSLLVIMN